jgi:hypothetical protein
MPHSVAQIKAAVNNKSKAAFRLPTVRRSQREEEGVLVRYHSSGQKDNLTDKNPTPFFSSS